MSFSGECVMRTNPSNDSPPKTNTRRFFSSEGARICVRLAHMKKRLHKEGFEVPKNIQTIAEKQCGWKFD